MFRVLVRLSMTLGGTGRRGAAGGGSATGVTVIGGGLGGARTREAQRAVARARVRDGSWQSSRRQDDCGGAGRERHAHRAVEIERRRGREGLGRWRRPQVISANSDGCLALPPRFGR